MFKKLLVTSITGIASMIKYVTILPDKVQSILMSFLKSSNTDRFKAGEKLSEKYSSSSSSASDCIVIKSGHCDFEALRACDA